jgi:hypothetical protein
MDGFVPGSRARVILPYQSQYPDAIVVCKGDALVVGQKDTEWLGWVWCTAPSGKCGWVPQRIISLDGDTCQALVDYDAKELTVAIGDELILFELESGWFLAQTGNGLKGWIPDNHIEMIQVGN